MHEYHRDITLPVNVRGLAVRENPLARAFELITENRMAAASTEEGRLSNLNQAASSIEVGQLRPTDVEAQTANGSVELFNAGE